jgi:hypothetical protein
MVDDVDDCCCCCCCCCIYHIIIIIIIIHLGYLPPIHYLTGPGQALAGARDHYHWGDEERWELGNRPSFATPNHLQTTTTTQPQPPNNNITNLYHLHNLLRSPPTLLLIPKVFRLSSRSNLPDLTYSLLVFPSHRPALTYPPLPLLLHHHLPTFTRRLILSPQPDPLIRTSLIPSHQPSDIPLPPLSCCSYRQHDLRASPRATSSSSTSSSSSSSTDLTTSYLRGRAPSSQVQLLKGRAGDSYMVQRADSS